MRTASLIPLKEIVETNTIEALAFNESVLGFAFFNNFEEVPFLNPESFKSLDGYPQLIGEKNLVWKGSFDSAFGLSKVNMTLHMTDFADETSSTEIRYQIASFSTDEGKQLPVFGVLKDLLQLEQTGTLNLPNQTEIILGHELNFNLALETTVWLSSHDLNKVTHAALLTQFGIANLPNDIPAGYSWKQKMGLKTRHDNDWFLKSLEEIDIRFVYRKGIRFDEVEIDFDIQHNEESNPTKNKSIELAVDQISIFFNYAPGQTHFNGFGLRGHLKFNLKNGLSNGLVFNSRLATTTGQLDLNIDNSLDLEDIINEFGVRDGSEKDQTFSDILGDLGHLRLASLNGRMNVYNFNVQQLGFRIDTDKEGIRMGDHLNFFPQLTVDVLKPFGGKERKTNVRIGGFARVFGAYFKAFYSTADKSFFISQEQGSISTANLMSAMNLPSMERFHSDKRGLEIMDLEFNAWQDNGKWSYAGEISIENDWDFGFENFKLKELHGEFHCYSGVLEEFTITGQFEMGRHLLSASVNYFHKRGYSLTAFIRNIKLDTANVSKWINIKEDFSPNKTDQAHHNKIKQEFGLELTIEEIMISFFIPEDKEKPKQLRFVSAVKIENRLALPIPLDHILLEVDYEETIAWKTILHFNFVNAYTDENGRFFPETDFQLEAEKDGDGLRFTGEFRNIRIIDFIEFLEDRFVINIKDDLPAFIRGTKIKSLKILLKKNEDNNWAFDFKCAAKIPLNNAEIDANLHFNITQEKAEKAGEKKYWTVDLDLEILSKDLGFDFVFTFHHQKAINHLLVDLSLTDTDFKISELLNNFLPTNAEIPLPEIGLKEVFFAVHSNAADKEKIKRNLLFGAVLDAEIDLTQAGFLANIIPGEAVVGIDDFRLVYALRDWTAKEIKSLTEFSGAEKHNLLLPKTESTESKSDTALAKGFAISGTLKVGDLSHDFVVNQGHTQAASDDDSTEDTNEKLVDDETTNEDVKAPKLLLKDEAPTGESGTLTKWFKINKKLGPIHIQRFGIQFRFKSMEIAMLLDAGLEIAVISASVVGLGVRSPIHSFEPHVQLAGLGVDFKRGSFEIGGAIVSRSNEHLDLAGMLTLGFNTLNMSILGAYKSDGKHSPSLLLYGNLNYPIGGPPFFFVEGLAAGIGVHRKVNLPTINEIQDFPLVSMVMKPAELQGAESLNTGIAQLEAHIPVEQDQFFFAAGIKFSTFKVIHSFVLVMLSLGKHTELDVLGYSELILPKNVGKTDPIAQARLLVRAAFVPEMGTLEVEARLDSAHSYLLSKACKLQGGFAFYTWFKAEKAPNNGGKPGDFVLTLGGYHPNFKVPNHYPQVPRLGFQWEVDKHMHFKGELYFALTPSHVMAGGLLEGVWAQGHLSASFRLGFNALIAWQPFHYEVEAFLNVKAGYHHGLLQFDGELKANIQIWGPDFGGTASLEVLFIKVKATFGAPKETRKQVLNWNQFSDRMLPGNTYFNGRISEGKWPSKESNAVDLGIVNADGFTLDFDCAVPFVSYQINEGSVSEKGNEYGIPAMDKDKVSSLLKISITRNGERVDHFDIQTRLDSGPYALWGENKKIALNDPALVDHLLFGFTLSPKQTNYQLIGAGLKLDHEQDIMDDEVHFSGNHQESNPFVFADITPDPPELTAEMKAFLNQWN